MRPIRNGTGFGRLPYVTCIVTEPDPRPEDLASGDAGQAQVGAAQNRGKNRTLAALLAGLVVMVFATVFMLVFAYEYLFTQHRAG